MPGERLPLGEALALPVGLADGLAEADAVRVGEAGRLPVGRGAGLVLDGGGALLVAAEGDRDVGGALGVTVGRGRRKPSPPRFSTAFRAGCVVARSGGVDEVGESVTSSRESSGSGWSGIVAARGVADWGSTDAAATPPRTVKAAAARDLTAYLLIRGGRLSRPVGSSCGGVGAPGPSAPSGEPVGPGSSLKWNSAVLVPTVAGATSPGSPSGAIRES
ncbi:hypothetical protein [Streptomyces sp. NPDC086766]|uniref:hypothetical protein n=1 Tax=Streptomyces sp. NPDC086766 TaxID=3365754 RepID=UPI0038277CB1